jgi:hypothetical protein
MDIQDIKRHSSNTLNLPDPEIVEAYERAAVQNVLAAVNNEIFFGYWSVCADGQGFGYGNTYPSLDGHQMTDALLWLGQTEIVKANWDYVRSFQKPNGQLPIAILPGIKEIRGVPVEQNGGLYKHWVPGDPLRALGSTTYIQNADVIFRYTQDQNWLISQLPSINLAADFLASLVTPEGFVKGAGYYVERPTRIEYDGVAQCYSVDAFQRVSVLNRWIGENQAVQRYQEFADRIAENFRRNFWVGDHFAEYIHPQRGIIANHGLTDVDWAAIATGVASPEQIAILWPQLKDEQRFYYGGMPTGIATHPETYEDWEFSVPDRHDLAAMGRVWYTECWARARMGDGEGIVNSIRRVCKAGRDNGYYWWERYYPDDKGGYTTGGPNTYCEYPANLIRIIQRFLLGIEFQLDGTIVITPTAPAEFWQSGFGQRLSWRGQTLFYQCGESQVTGNFSGTQSQRLYLRINRHSRSTEIQVIIDGYLVSPKIQKDFIVIDLPYTKQPCNFEVRILS